MRLVEDYFAHTEQFYHHGDAEPESDGEHG
jgi:hypothetical protein